MQIANVTVMLDKSNAVPKYGVTAAEIAVLRAIHGPESVTDIEPAGEIKRQNSEELGRLNDIYRGARDDDNQPVLRSVFPVASSLHVTLDDLNLPDELYKAKTRAKPGDKPSKDAKGRAEGQNETLDEQQEREQRETAEAAERQQREAAEARERQAAEARKAADDSKKQKPKQDAFD